MLYIIPWILRLVVARDDFCPECSETVTYDAGWAPSSFVMPPALQPCMVGASPTKGSDVSLGYINLFCYLSFSFLLFPSSNFYLLFLNSVGLNFCISPPGSLHISTESLRFTRFRIPLLRARKHTHTCEHTVIMLYKSDALCCVILCCIIVAVR